SRDHAGQGLVDGPGGTVRSDGLTDFRRAGVVAGAGRRLRAAVPGRHRPASVRHYLDRHFHGDAGTQHAAVRSAADADTTAATDAFRWQYPAREHAGLRAKPDAGRADYTFHRRQPGHSLSWRRLRRGVAAFPDTGGDRRGILRHRATALSQNPEPDGLITYRY